MCLLVRYNGRVPDPATHSSDKESTMTKTEMIQRIEELERRVAELEMAKVRLAGSGSTGFSLKPY